ncbi:TetR family transcriptional regulator [Stappia sp. GBMRC 2046]|uniref:TetR family transcriptional regulator n=1 Tax=Stappia sediminis TaxID=2692190 RepID=A0A7X3LQS8_9HYPH|nr:TetR/AcrR family transcriptional regulator [Stappia sediminis]MXN63382.1 TetR family transcriptional regulator [Stappia sediminis]
MSRIIAERADVIPALGEIFRRCGYEGASIARITRETGLGKGSLYNFFPGGKEEMAEAVLANIHQWFEENIYRPLETEAPDDALKQMFSGVSSYFRSGERICLVGAFALEETRDRFSSEVTHYFHRWLETLAGCLRRKGYAPSKAKDAASYVIAGIQGAIVLVRATDDAAHFATILKTLKSACDEPRGA